MRWFRILLGAAAGAGLPVCAGAETANPPVAAAASPAAEGRLHVIYRRWEAGPEPRFDLGDARWNGPPSRAQGARVVYGLGDGAELYMGYVKTRSGGVFDPGRDWQDRRRRAYAVGFSARW